MTNEERVKNLANRNAPPARDEEWEHLRTVAAALEGAAVISNGKPEPASFSKEKLDPGFDHHISNSLEDPYFLATGNVD